jgi:NADH dehydrogenase
MVEALDRIMPEIPPSLAEFASRELRRRGIELRTGTRLERMDDRSAVLTTGERIPTRMVCWTAGVKPPAVVGQLGLPLTEGGRIDVDATMRVKGLENVWAIGDAAAVPDPAQRRRAPTPPTCQHAIRQGRVVGSNVAAALVGKKPRPFRYRTLGVFVDMGRFKAVATILGLRLRGFPAWFAARTYHLAMMPGAARRVRLGADWAVGLVFGRASAELGQLGHPPALSDYLEEMSRAGDTPER